MSGIRRHIVLVACLAFVAGPAPGLSAAQTLPDDLVTHSAASGRFPLVADGVPASVVVSEADDRGVVRAAGDLTEDLRRVSGTMPGPGGGPVVVVGTIGRSPLIERFVDQGRVSVAGIADRWEAFMIQALGDTLVVAGSDPRGTIYGVYELSRRIGVSPWHYWADVPVRPASELHVLPGRHVDDGPAVRYRGIFINDENPALLGWVNETFGGFNHAFYETVFKLVLRMKGNYLWPAMWGKAFADDDSLNAVLADEYGVVMGTSHHEPMMRAHVEWERYGEGAWDYTANEARLRRFWRTGIERMGDHESIVTLGMRGDGDEPMTEGTATELLERIVEDQRAILEDATGKPADETPQVWALYKEVQDYYDEGMQVPEDVTLLFADDNWGNIRRLPDPDALPRTGGYGVYYHFDYVGGPRSYRWINTNQISRIREQMNLAYESGADRIWIVNVGDIKPMELPTQFFLDFAWDPEAWPNERLPEYTVRWAAEQFGNEFAPEIAPEIAALLDAYTRFNSRRKPELLSPDTYSLVNHREFERVMADWDRLRERSERIREALPAGMDDAYFQLVHFPIAASANLNEFYWTVAKNRLYAGQGRAATDSLAERAGELFAEDEELARILHEDIAGGKWNHMMSQTHIGYTSWDNPPENVMPEVRRIGASGPAETGVAVEGSRASWPGADIAAVLPEFSPYGAESHYIEVFNRGPEPLSFTAEPGAPWLHVAPPAGTAGLLRRLEVHVDFKRAPRGRTNGKITIRGSDGTVVSVDAPVFNPPDALRERVQGFVEAGGAIAIEAHHYTKAVDDAPVRWTVVPGLGRTSSGVTVEPATAVSRDPGARGPHLVYRFHTFDTAVLDVTVHLSPTLDIHDTGGLRYGVSIDDGPVRVVNMHEDDSHPAWQDWVRRNINSQTTTHESVPAGGHELKFWMVDPGIVLQRLVIDAGSAAPSYLGPPESRYEPGNTPRNDE